MNDNNSIFEYNQYYGQLDSLLKKEMKKKPTIYRLTGVKNRIYFTKEDENSPPTVYNSGTTIIDNFRDKNGEEAIHNWKIGLINSGKDPHVQLIKRQNYGTLLHILYGRLLSGETTSFNKLKEFIISCAKDARISKQVVEKLLSTNYMEFQKDVASFLTWIRDYKVQPLAIELMVKSDKYKVATALDLICYINTKEKGYWGEVYKTDSKVTSVKKGDPKETSKMVRKLVIVDFKSGKKGFFPKNVLQLLLSKKIFEESFPDIKVEGIFNFAPNDWKIVPTFKMYDQERESKQINYLKAILENVLERGKFEFEEKMEKAREMVMVGSIDVNNIQDDMFKKVDLFELANIHYKHHFSINRDVFGDFVKEFEITSDIELREALDNLPILTLKDLALAIGIKYRSRIQFTNILTEKYVEQHGED